MPTNDERREVAKRIREMYYYGGIKRSVVFYEALNDVIMGQDGFGSFQDIADRFADLIEPEERTCHMIRGHLTDTVFCDVCGERFDGVAQYMAMVPNGFSLADYKAKYKDAKFCPNCGAKVVER